MFYKKIGNKWYTGSRINLPNGKLLDKNNKENSEGWEWYDEPPADFLVDEHKEGFEKATEDRITPDSVVDISTLVINSEVLENKREKTFSVSIYLDGAYYYLENLSYDGFLTESEIEQKIKAKIK